ncbi:MAG: hypothetical protein U1F66_00025 [bacterium]
MRLNAKLPIALLIKTGLFCSLLACSGMSGSGRAPGVAGDGGPGGALDAGNSMGGGSGASGGGLGSGGDLGQGEGVPSTQTSEGSIGGGCRLSFRVNVRVIENGYVRLCDGRRGPKENMADVVAPTVNASMKSLRMMGEVGDLPTEAVDDPQPLGPAPRITFSLLLGGAPQTQSFDAECKADGSWQSPESALFYRIGMDSSGRCGHAGAQASAQMKVDDQIYSSSIFNGPPFPEQDANGNIPLLLTIHR